MENGFFEIQNGKGKRIVNTQEAKRNDSTMWYGCELNYIGGKGFGFGKTTIGEIEVRLIYISRDLYGNLEFLLYTRFASSPDCKTLQPRGL